MAAFQFSDHRYIELDFPGSISYRLKLDSETLKRWDDSRKYLVSHNTAVSGRNDPEALDDICDLVMDAIDIMLGEGEAERILGQKADYDYLDAMDVHKYISNEIIKAANLIQSEYNGVSASVQSTRMNRAQRLEVARKHGHSYNGATAVYLDSVKIPHYGGVPAEYQGEQ